MSVNITENYYTCKNNAKNTFWQGFGMGVLGQLTGMGGYGMGGYGMSSIFNCGFGGYGMGYGYGMGCGGYGMGYGFGNAWGMNDAYVGAQVGMMGLGVIFQGLSGYITERKAAKAEAAETVTTASIEQSASKHLKVINEVADNITLDTFDVTKTASQYSYTTLDNDVTKANTEYANAQADTATAKAALELLGGETGPKATDAKYKLATPTEDGKTIDEEKFKKDYAEWSAKKAEVDNLKEIEAEKKDAVTSAKKARTDKETEVKAAITALKPLKEQYEAIEKAEKDAQDRNNQKIYEKADGSPKTRMSEDDFKSKFYKEDGTIKDNIDSSDVDKSAIQTAANHLTNAKTNEDKKRYSKEFKKLYEACSDNKIKKGTFEEVYKLAQKNV